MNEEIPFRMEQENIDMSDEIARLRSAIHDIEALSGSRVVRGPAAMLADLVAISRIARAALISKIA